ncbi:MAG: esterase [Alphaproteobacteria bacterium]|nr:esterase [Alphaproteobacteria bacterium]
MALKALMFWRRPPPVLTLEDLVSFTETRAKFVSQTSLFGYVRTRAGTRYASLMEDDIFANSVNIAKWEIYLACLCDLATFTAARVGRHTSVDVDVIRQMAVHIVDSATRNEEVPAERPQGFEDVRANFADQAKTIIWAENETGEAAFQSSLSALVEWAPIADELKINDVEIVKNSMRFKWKSVRDQFETLLDADAVLADWHEQDRLRLEN